MKKIALLAAIVFSSLAFSAPTFAQSAPVVSALPASTYSDPLARFELSILPSMSVVPAIENKNDKFSAFVPILNSIAATAQPHQNQLQARG